MRGKGKECEGREGGVGRPTSKGRRWKGEGNEERERREKWEGREKVWEEPALPIKIVAAPLKLHVCLL